MKLDSSITAIVAGGASGLGAATARALAAAGVKVGIFDIDADGGAQLAAQTGGVFQRVDVTDERSIDAGLAHVRQALGQERIVVSCAGIGSGVKTARRDRESGAISSHPLADFRRVVELNLVGSFAVLSKSAAGMLSLVGVAAGDTRGVLINTGSIAAEDGQVGQAAYAASKGAIASMTLPMARDLSLDGIRVATILPGLFDTPIYDRRPGGEERRRKLAANFQFPPRFGRPEEFASMVLEICRNDYINAAVYRLDGAVRLGAR
jgi:NAD(P)-dependent dehydrogenase (short-subunit alcohol dehydrogenase family)